MSYITRSPSRCIGCGQTLGVAHLACCPYRDLC